MKSVKLEVPFVSGGESILCAGASLKMILMYYGLSVEQKAIEVALDERHGGTDMAQIGRFLMAHAFATEWVTLHPQLFIEQDGTLGQEALMMKIKNMIEFDAGRSHDQIALRNLVTYMTEGGIITPRRPNFDLVRREIDAGRPVIAFFPTDHDMRGESTMNFHPVVITGYDSSHVLVNDPDHRQNYHKKIRTDWFFGGIYAGRHEILDDGSFLLVRHIGVGGE